jgi:outer membrane lipoprotein-sorting protein
MSRKTLMGIAGLLALVSLLAALALGGCAKKPTAQEIVAQIKEVIAATDDAHAVVDATANVQGESVTVVAEVWQAKPNKGRVEVLETDRAEFAGIVSVSDGESFWLYIPAKNTVTVADVSDEAMDLQTFIQNMDEVIQQVLDESDVEVLGEETVAGTETYKLRLTPQEGEERRWPVEGTATLWVDQEQWMVLKAHLVAPNIGQGTVEVRSFELNPGLAAEVFAFQVPEGARVIRAAEEKPQHLTLDEARAQAGFDLLTPTYRAEDLTLVDVLLLKGAFLLVYDLDGASLTVAQSGRRLPPGPLGAEESTTVRGTEALLITDRVTGSHFVSWQENGRYYYVLGRVDSEEILKIAESLE